MSDLLTDGTLDFLDRLRAANLARAGQRANFGIDDWTPAEWAVNLAGEVGEALNVLKKMRRIATADLAHVEPPLADNFIEFARLHDHFEDELADAMICVDLLAARMRLDLATIVARKFNKTSDRWGSSVRLKP